MKPIVVVVPWWFMVTVLGALTLMTGLVLHYEMVLLSTYRTLWPLLKP